MLKAIFMVKTILMVTVFSFKISPIIIIIIMAASSADVF